MRLRNIPRAEGVLEACKEVVKNPAGQKSRWHELFQNQNPVHIEIGMGKGQFLLTLAERNPDINYIGIERYSSVLLRAVEKFQLLSESPKGAPSNIRFLCMDARELPEVFAPGEIEKIYLNFSDPLPKLGYSAQRLTNPRFLEIYAGLLSEGGEIWQKTDNEPFFDYSLQCYKECGWKVTEVCRDLAAHPFEGNVLTEHERKFMSEGRKIFRAVAVRP